MHDRHSFYLSYAQAEHLAHSRILKQLLLQSVRQMSTF
jgi:hypothetical protein